MKVSHSSTCDIKATQYLRRQPAQRELAMDGGFRLVGETVQQSRDQLTEREARRRRELAGAGAQLDMFAGRVSA